MNQIIDQLANVGSVLTTAAIFIAAGIFFLGAIQREFTGRSGLVRLLHLGAVLGSAVLGSVVVLMALLYALGGYDSLLKPAIYCLITGATLMLLFFGYLAADTGKASLRRIIFDFSPWKVYRKDRLPPRSS